MDWAQLPKIKYCKLDIELLTKSKALKFWIQNPVDARPYLEVNKMSLSSKDKDCWEKINCRETDLGLLQRPAVNY